MGDDEAGRVEPGLGEGQDAQQDEGPPPPP